MDFTHYSNPSGPRSLDVVWSSHGGPARVKGPVYRLRELPVGATGRYGTITRHTPAWARSTSELVAVSRALLDPRQSGHEIEGHVTLAGRRYSAFTSGGTNPQGGEGMIIVRGYEGKAPISSWTTRVRNPHRGTFGPHGGISPGDRVTFIDPRGQRRSGRAVMRGTHGWVLNMGGRHGTPAVVADDAIVSVQKRRS